VAPAASIWLAREFERSLQEVHERLAVAGAGDPFIRLACLVDTIDQLREGASVDQLRQSRSLLEVELERRAKEAPSRAERADTIALQRPRLVPLEQLFDNFVLSGRAPSHEIGGRSL